MNREAKLLSGEGTAFEQAMLRSVKGEAPSPALSSKMMGPLVAAPPPLAGPVGHAPSSSVVSSGAAKWAITAAAALGLGGAVATGIFPQAFTSNSSAEIKQTPVSTQPEPLNVEPSSESSPQEAKDARLKSADDPIDRSSATALPKASAHSSPEGRAHPENNQLAEEMRLLDQARAALAQKAPEKALRLLGTYDSRYPQGTLRQEATVLRVSALKGTGQQSQAAQLADKFLEESPNSAHKSRLQAEDGAQEPAR